MAGGSDAGNSPPQWPTRQRHRAAMGRGGSKGRKKEAGGERREQNPWEWGETPEASRPPSSPPTPWGSGSNPEVSRPPEFPPTPKGSAPSYPRRPPFFAPCSRLAPWRPYVSASLAVAEGTFRPLLPPALAPPPSPLAPLSCVPNGDTVIGAWLHYSSSVPHPMWRRSPCSIPLSHLPNPLHLF